VAIFTVKDPSGRVVGVVRQAGDDESAVRELMAGKGKGRDERFLGHDGGYEVSLVEADGPAKVLWRDEAGVPATEQAPVAGQEPDNRGRK
jgi:hypothetical protein